MELSSYGVTEVTKVSTWLDRACEEIARDGYTVVLNAVSDEEVSAYQLLLETCYQKQLEELETEALEAIKDRNIVRLPLAYEDKFLQLATLPPIVEVATAILGNAFVLLMQNGIINPARQAHQQTSWHRDLNYQHWTSSRPLAINALVCLDPFTVTNGATTVLPGSHLFAPFPSEEYVAKSEKQIEAPAGSVIMMNAMTFHRAGVNRSTAARRAVNHVIGAPILSQQIDIPSALNGKGQADDFLGRYLGYRWNPKASVAAWRQSKLKAGNDE